MRYPTASAKVLTARHESEAGFQAAVMQAAQLLGWETLHVRPVTAAGSGRTSTPTTGTMAMGWPDLVLLNPDTGHLVVAEMKSASGRLTDDQQRVLRAWRMVEAVNARVDVFVWKPSDYHTIEVLLRHG